MGNLRPIELWGSAAEGRKVYIDLGCIYCHSQQVRPEGFGADIERGWGSRRTVAVDYIYDSPHLLGTMRTGPDLLNIGARQPDENWHYQHLYDPNITSQGSNMAPLPFLFEKHVVEAPGALAPANAVRMPEGYLPDGHYIVPTQRGKDLVAYLKTLDRGYDVPGVIQ
jgi:cytochrome c oxidase cbb3-type subunit 2